MSTMNISLPESLKTFIDGQVAERGYATSSEYIRELIRRELDQEKLRVLLMDGATSPMTGQMTPIDFDNLRNVARGVREK